MDIIFKVWFSTIRILNPFHNIEPPVKFSKIFCDPLVGTNALVPIDADLGGSYILYLLSDN